MSDKNVPRITRRRLRRAIPGTSHAFDGTFTPEIRELMRSRRNALGVSLQQLAELLGVNISTLRKWESGQIDTCQVVHINHIVEFLSGEYDRRLKAASVEARNFLQLWTSLPEEVSGRLERALTIYRICTGHPDLQDNLMDGFDNAMGGTLQRLMTRAWPSGTRSLGIDVNDSEARR